jgi:hypothetical protein
MYLFETIKIMLVTERQREFINFIQDETGIIFTGCTKDEARKYITENKDKIPPSGSMNMWAIVNGY